MPYLLEAVELEAEGIEATEIDRQALAFGMPMGPVELADTVGLDICLHVAEILSEHMGTIVPQRLRDLVETGHLGRKSGKGFYQYRKGKPVKSKNVPSHQGGHEIIDRMILRMLNEVVACLHDKVVDEADLLDGGMVYGTGFAPFRGGPLHHIEAVGADVIYGRLQELEQQYGSRFHPGAGWEQVSGFSATDSNG